jgi:hypothetical protein
VKPRPKTSRHYLDAQIMLMRYGILLLSLLLIGCGKNAGSENEMSGSSQTEEEVGEPGSAETSPEEVDQPLDVEATIESIRFVYEEIEGGKKSKTLQKDSVLIDCFEGEFVGTLYWYTREEQTVLVEFGVAQGDHGGIGESWYFRNGDPIFVFRESSYWQFDGPEREMPDGTMAMGTKDVFTEDRFYVHNGKVIRALTKDYEVLSWADEPTNPDNVPNQHMETDGALPETWDFVAEFIKTGRVDCELLD